MRVTRTYVLGLAAMSILGCSSKGESSTKSIGTLGGPCTQDGACDPGLACISKLCITTNDGEAHDAPTLTADSGAGGAKGETGTGSAGSSGGSGGNTSTTTIPDAHEQAFDLKTDSAQSSSDGPLSDYYSQSDRAQTRTDTMLSTGDSVSDCPRDGGSTTSDGFGSGSTDRGGSGNDGAMGCGNQLLLDELSATLVDLFVVNAGIIVVDSSGVKLIGRDAQVLKSVPFTKPITAAAFDGATLVVTNDDELTAMTPSLDLGPTAPITESCASAVMVSQNRFICGPSKDSKRVFYTYDVGVNPPLQIATSSEYSFNGIPMRRVPGTDSFVTVENNSEPPGFSLFTVSPATGEASLGGSSPYDDYQPYTGQDVAFDGTPATHMIQADGNMLSLTGSGCDGSESNSRSCFLSSGFLGTLSSEQSYLGLGDDGAGQLVALVMQIADFHLGQPLCGSGCHVQIIDIASRSILHEQTFTSDNFWAVVRLTYDSLRGNVIMGFKKFDQSEVNLSKGYKIQSFGF